MTPLIINLGKTGDIVSLLPPVRVLAAEQGAPVKWMVAKKFASVLEGCSYVDPVIWDGDWLDLRGAYNKAKEFSTDIVVCQQAGPSSDVKELSHLPAWPKGMPVPQSGAHAFEDCFVKQAWRCLGKQALRRQCPPMVFDNRDEKREKEVLQKVGAGKSKLLLVSCGGQSSPFRFKKLLTYLLHTRFKKPYWKVVDLDDIECERFYDMLGLFEQATILVATDSAPLHLARSVPTLPVIALTQDKPTLWHGSPWQPSHALYCRYGDFPERALEVMDAIEGHLAAQIRTPVAGPTRYIWAYHGRNTWVDNDRHQWQLNNASWVLTEAEPGALGRDGGGFPFLKCVVGLATMRARMEDIIVLTRGSACVQKIPTGNCWSHRTTRTADGDKWCGVVDMLAFTRQWWETNSVHLPDFIMGPDSFWSRSFMELLKATGGTELEGGCFERA